MNALVPTLPRRARLLPLPAFFMLAPLLAQAQSTGSVSGVIRSAETHAPLQGATVVLRDAADSTARRLGDISDASGAFTIEHVPLGRRYTLEVAFVGYGKHLAENVTLTAEKPTLSLGAVELRPEELENKGIKVTSQREQVQIMADKTVYGVENNPSYTATNVSELLGQIPSVDVDQDGKISLRGNEQVTIMMNDRPITMPAEQRNKFLQSLPASMVKDIEIRTNPGAKFDAKYEGGIINIVTRKTMSDMFGGNVNAGGDSRPGVNVGAGLYYNGEDLTASIGGGVNHGPNEGSSTTLRLNYRDTNEYRDQGAGTSESVSNSRYGYGQIDYKISQNDLASLSFNLNHWSSEYTSYGNHTFYNAGGAVVGRYFDSSAPGMNTGNAGGYNTASFLLKHTFGEGHKLSLDASFNSNGYNGENNYSSTYYRQNGELDSARSTARSSSSDRSNSTFITTLDYENAIDKQFTLSLGGKNEINSLDNRTLARLRDHASGEFVVDSLQTSHYLPKNSIYAGYANLAYRPFDAFSIQAGVRYEKANVSAKYESGAEIISRDYTNIFPSGSLSYNLSEQQSLTLSYRRSVALPDIDALNPTRVKWSDFFEYSGNPDLEPEFTNSFELNYSTFWGMGNMLSIAPYYSSTEGSIERNQTLEDGVTRMTYANYNGAYSLGSEISLSMRPWQWLNFRASGNIFQKVNRGSTIAGDIHSSAFGSSGNASLNADVMEGLTFSLTLFFSNPPTVGASTQSGHNYWSLGLRQRLIENKLNISLRVNDPLNLQKWESSYDSPELFTSMSNKWTSRFVGLNLSYTFGTTPRMEQHKQDKSDTKGGGGSGGAGGGGE